MWVTVWYNGMGSDEFVSLDTPFCDLTKMFDGATDVEIDGDSF